ncbi:4'-phosphopantetheinyl transferase family protein [Photobacterium sp. DNB22_13_2]
MSFIYNKQELVLPHLEAYCEICQFESSEFEHSQFEHFGVRCPDEIARSVYKRQAEYLAGRYLAKSALQQLDYHAVYVGRGASREPLWPQGVVGSISHSKGYAVCVVALNNAPDAGIGLDIERLIEPDIYQSFVGMVIDQAEKQKINEIPLEDRLLNTLLFSAKEAIFKALFPQVGRYFDFLDVAFEFVEKQCLYFTLNVNLSGDLPKGSGIKVYWLQDQYGVLCYTDSSYIFDNGYTPAARSD